jgi:hypothetical protein
LIARRSGTPSRLILARVVPKTHGLAKIGRAFMDVSNGYMQGSLGPASKPRTQLLVSLPIYTRAGDIERVAHGVYRLVCFPAHRFADLIATALWAGSDSAVSHESALAVYAQA